MSAHYTINISIQIRTNLHLEDQEMLEFLVNESSKKPDRMPSHQYFTKGISIEPFPKRYRGYFAEGGYVSRYWTSLPNGEVSPGVHLLLPTIKTPHHWEALETIDWLASLCNENGFIGTMTDDFPDQSVMLLYIYDSKLFFGDRKASEFACLSTGEKRILNS
mgnify:CR=1 FL=1